MSLFSAISKKLNMSEEERAIEKEAKSLLSDFNSLISRYEIWYSNCNNKNKTYQSMLSFREIDENMLKESKLDISIDNLEKSYNILNNYIQPSIKFSMSMKEKNIKMNNMDLNEKKLIIDPLRKHIFHMKDWEVKKNLFEDNLSKAYESVINKFAIIDISTIESYASSYLDLSLNKSDSVVEKVNLIETVLNNGKVALEVYMRVFGDMLNHNDSLEEELGESLDKIYKIDCQQKKSFLVIIVERTAIDLYRKNQKKNQKVQEMDEFETSPFFCKHERGYGESEMMEVFHKIPKLYAEVLILRYVNELGVSEIAELLNIKQNTVSKRIARGIAIIRKEWLGNE